MKTLYGCILESLEQGKALVEVTIIEQQGSAPRTAGAKMLVMQNMSIAGVAKGVGIRGTVGGGLYEAKAIGLAETLFAAHGGNVKQNESHEPLALIVHFDLRGSHFPTDMDMVCGGELRLLVEYIPATQAMCALYSALVQAESLGQACTLAMRVRAQGLINQDTHYAVHVDKSLFFADMPSNTAGASLQNTAGAKLQSTTTDSPTTAFSAASRAVNLENLDTGLNSHLNTYSDNHNPQVLSEAVKMHIRNNEGKKIGNLLLDGYEYIFEALHKPYTIHIFGAGHVSCELAKITHYLNFRTVVMDDRAEFANAERFPDAVSLVFPSLDQACIADYFHDNKPDSHDGIVIVTRGHAKDRDVLAASLKTEAGYIGMIGSKSKRQTTYNYLLSSGYSKEDFEKIHSPIGLSIGAQTPEEIAISITAELIQWRAKYVQAI